MNLDDELSPESRARLAQLDLEIVPPPRLWFRCGCCGAVFSPEMRRGGDLPPWACPNGCNEGRAQR